MYIQNLVKLCQLVLKILSGNKILTSIKGHNSVANLRKMTLYNPNLDLINVNVYTKFGLILSFQYFWRYLTFKIELLPLKGEIIQTRKQYRSPFLTNQCIKFQNPCFIVFRSERCTDKPKPICSPPFESWGHKKCVC